MDAWRETCDIKTFAHPQRVHLRPGKGGDGNWHVLKVLLALLCDDDDFFQNALREDWAGQGGACHGADQGFAKDAWVHLYAPW